MTRYKQMTLGDLITVLETLGDSPVYGLNGAVESYRGWYDRNATEPVEYATPANTLAAFYRSEVGKPIVGYKGGDYIVSENEPIYYAEWGLTGPTIIGFEPDDSDVYHPVLLEENYRF